MNKDYIIFSSIDWDVLWQLHQQLTTSLIKDNNRVLFVENTGVRNIKISDTSRLLKKIKSRLNSFAGIVEIDKKFSLLIPIIFPFPYSKLFTNLNYLLLRYKIRKWMRITNFKDPTIITFLPTPLMHKIIDSFNSSLKIYYCANHMAKGSDESQPLRKWEDLMFKKVNSVFSISSKITERALPFNSNVSFFPPGVDFNKFNKKISNNINLEYFENINGPIVGYIGAITKVLDKELIANIANRLKNVNFIFIGPVLTNINALKKINNIHFLGQKDHDVLPAYIKKFDIGIIPYIVNDFTNSVYCCKLNEYLSMGLPVISTDINEVVLFNKKYKIIEIAKNKNIFIDKINFFLNKQTNELRDELIDKRINVAKENSWENRFKKINLKIQEDLDNFLLNKSSKDYSFKKIYTRSRNKFLSILLIVILFYCTIMYTPLFWIAGDKLVITEPPEKSQAIVIFSGDGESSYENASYQKRSIDALKYLNNNYAESIILSSGRGQTIKEVEVLRALLIDKGVKRESIYIFEQYPKNTYENVIMVRDYLRINKIDKIMFITSPYHSRRSKMIWNKNAPDIDVTIPLVIDSPSRDMQWQSSKDKIKVIIYEYLSILYNWFKQRL